MTGSKFLMINLFTKNFIKAILKALLEPECCALDSKNLISKKIFYRTMFLNNHVKLLKGPLEKEFKILFEIIGKLKDASLLPN